MTYALTRNKRSSKWQFRKRYPADIARILPGEFVKSTGEEEKRAAQARVPLIAAEYERRVAEARAKLAEAPPVTLGKPQILAMAAQFYAEGLETYTLKHAVGPEEHRAAVQGLRERLDFAEGAARRKDFGIVRFAVNRRVGAAGLALPDDSPEMAELLEQHMRAYIDAHRHCIAVLEGEGDLAPSLWRADAQQESAVAPSTTIESLLKSYEADKEAGWSSSSKSSPGCPIAAGRLRQPRCRIDHPRGSQGRGHVVVGAARVPWAAEGTRGPFDPSSGQEGQGVRHSRHPAEDDQLPVPRYHCGCLQLGNRRATDRRKPIQGPVGRRSRRCRTGATALKCRS